MNDTVIVAIVSLFGTLAGTFGGDIEPPTENNEEFEDEVII